MRLLLALILLTLLLSACEQRPLLQRLQAGQKLKIATVGGPLTCYSGIEGPGGLEYDLVSEFAHSLDLLPVFTVFPDRETAIRAVKTGQQHMAAAFIMPNTEQKRHTLPSIPWHMSSLRLLQNMADKDKISQLNETQAAITVPAISLQHEILLQSNPNMAQSATSEASEESLLQQLNTGKIRATLTNTEQIRAHKPFLPMLSKGIAIPQAATIHWIFSRNFDTSLRDRANEFLALKLVSGELDRQINRALSQLPEQDYVTRRDFWRALTGQLPKYINSFKSAARETGIDWRLLAAISYQESHWKPEARSPFGAVGMMMLTATTAKQHKVKNRKDPNQNILAGAKHLLWMMERLPKRIQGEDQLWFTLANYNIGYGHLEDARILTQRQKADPDKWEEVKKRLPLLSQEAYYSTLKHGKARGGEPVHYVRNIRYYYALLVRWDNMRHHRYCDHAVAEQSDYLRLLRKN